MSILLMLLSDGRLGLSHNEDKWMECIGIPGSIEEARCQWTKHDRAMRRNFLQRSDGRKEMQAKDNKAEGKKEKRKERRCAACRRCMIKQSACSRLR